MNRMANNGVGSDKVMSQKLNRPCSISASQCIVGMLSYYSLHRINTNTMYRALSCTVFRKNYLHG